jgi:hypothetical protein
MNVANIKDYVTLFFDESLTVFNSTLFTWSIPVSYYSNQRSRVCSVSIVSANISTDVEFKTIILDYVNGGFNTYSSSDRRNIVAHLGVSDFANKVFETSHVTEPIRLLTNARPDKIQLKFLKDDNTEIVYNDMYGGCITLAFTYYDAEETDKQLHNQYTNVLR